MTPRTRGSSFRPRPQWRRASRPGCATPCASPRSSRSRPSSAMRDRPDTRPASLMVWTFRHPSAWLPVAMSGAALAVVIAHIVTVGIAREPDEGTAAHFWQLLMAGQLPLIAFFVFVHVASPRQVLPVLVLQLCAALAAVAPVFIFNW